MLCSFWCLLTVVHLATNSNVPTAVVGPFLSGEAIGVRSGRYKGFTAKDRIKDLEQFKLTGRHPEIEEVRARAAKEMLHPLPDVDLGRPRAFFDFSSNGRDLGVDPDAVCLPMPDISIRTRDAWAGRCDRLAFKPNTTGCEVFGTNLNSNLHAFVALKRLTKPAAAPRHDNGMYDHMRLCSQQRLLFLLHLIPTSEWVRRTGGSGGVH